jgi:hypothetical protein
MNDNDNLVTASLIPFRCRAYLASIGAALLLAATTVAYASGSATANARIQSVGTGPRYDSQCGYKCMLVAFDLAPSGSPCAMDAGWHYAINISTAEGRVTAGMVLAAKASGDLMEAHGTGTCVFSNRIEELWVLVAR